MRYAVPRLYSLPSRNPARQLACGAHCHPASVEARPAPTPLVSRDDFVRVVLFAPQRERKLSATIVVIASVKWVLGYHKRGSGLGEEQESSWAVTIYTVAAHHCDLG